MRDQTCTLAFLVQTEQILLARKKRGFGMGKWNGAGGKVEQTESIEAAMIRECQEELAIVPTQFEKVAVHDFVLQADTPAPWHQWTHVFLVTAWEGEPTETEEMAPRWFPRNAIPYIDMWSDDHYWLPLTLAGKKLKTTFYFDSSEQVLSHTITEVETI